MTDLTTNYLGLSLRNPVIASASPLSRTVDGVSRLADGGVSAIVLHSLFEEDLSTVQGIDAGLADPIAEYVVDADSAASARAYLQLLEQSVLEVDIPIIASLNGTTPDVWSSYARAVEDAGAAAIELNVNTCPSDVTTSSSELEARVLAAFESVRSMVSLPISVKLSPFLTSVGEMALRLDRAGADGLVLFNRFLHLDIDPSTVTLRAGIGLSQPEEGRLSRTWIALLRGRVQSALAGSTGVEDQTDVVKYLLAGADVVMTTSALLRHGPDYASSLITGLEYWMTTKGFKGVNEVRGLLSASLSSPEGGNTRARYVRTLGAANASSYEPL